MVGTSTAENIYVLKDMIEDIINCLPDTPPTKENFKQYHNVGKVLQYLGRQLSFKGHLLEEYYHAYVSGDYDEQSD